MDGLQVSARSGRDGLICRVARGRRGDGNRYGGGGGGDGESIVWQSVVGQVNARRREVGELLFVGCRPEGRFGGVSSQTLMDAG